MRRHRLYGLVEASALTVLLALWGCGSGAPSVSSSNAEATVHGTVKYKGEPIDGGEIRFDPANIQRRDAKQATAPIGKDGSYKITTLRGGNQVYVTLMPELQKKNPDLVTFMKDYDVPSGDSTFDVELAP
jgi:hypothetical protein